MAKHSFYSVSLTQDLIRLYQSLGASASGDVTTTYLGDNDIDHGCCFYWACHPGEEEESGSWVQE